MKKIITIIGARPQIIKAAAISRVIKKSFSNRISEKIVHTGQHYDRNMSGEFFLELDIPIPDFQFSITSALQGAQTGQMLTNIETVLLAEKPDAVLVYGDTNSTLAGALAASKIGIPLIHIEAGLRSFNKSMPEEINRITTDHCSSILFSPTLEGVRNLENEGLIDDADGIRIYHCGDVMYDNSLYFSKLANQNSDLLLDHNLHNNDFILLTCHRPSNTDSEQNLKSILEAVDHISKQDRKKIVFPLHPRTEKMIVSLLGEQYLTELKNKWIILPPVSFLEMILLESNCHRIITDSGGVQKEAYFFKKKSVILREETEWVEVIQNNGGLLAGASSERIMQAYFDLDKMDCSFPTIFGDGNAAEFICTKILETI